MEESETIMEDRAVVYLPGEEVKLPAGDGVVTIGPGLRRDGERVVAAQCGVLRHRQPLTFWLDVQSKRYVPLQGDKVLGIVIAKQMDTFRVDIGSAEAATLSYLSFEGATKKMRPNVKVGDVLYCQLSVASKHTEPEVVCADEEGRSRGLGLLAAGGLLVGVSLSVVRRLLAPDCALLRRLGAELRFELTAGMNGRVWVRANSHAHTAAIGRAVAACEFLDAAAIEQLVRRTVDVAQGFA